MIDRSWIGKRLPDSTFHIERGRLRFFAQAIGETRSIYTDVDAAQRAGHRDIVVLPTFLVAVEQESGITDALLVQLGIPLSNLLHGEQGFTYHHEVCAGDTVLVRSRIEDIYAKRGGALEFVVKASDVLDQDSRLVAEMRMVLVYRH